MTQTKQCAAICVMLVVTRGDVLNVDMLVWL